jgi:hypothetical protein
VFEGNFKGTHVRPGNSWDLRSYKQKPGESLRDYIRCFSKQCTELPNITDSDVIMAFLSETTYKELVWELGRNTPTTANELMDIVSNYTIGEEAVGGIFGADQDKGKRKDEDPESSNRGAKTNNRRKKKNHQGKHEATTDDLVTATNRKKPRGPSAGASWTRCSRNHVPTIRDPQTTTLRTATCSEKYFKSLGIKKDDKKEDPKVKDGDKDEGFSEIHDCFMIYGGPSTCLSMRQRKRERREIFSVQLVTPLFLDWFEMAITFDRGDHPDYVPNPRVYPLVVDPIIANTRLTKVLMDRGSILNIIYI